MRKVLRYMDLSTGLGLLSILITVAIGIFFASKKISNKKTYKNLINIKNLKDSDVKVKNIHIGDKNEKKSDTLDIE